MCRSLSSCSREMHRFYRGRPHRTRTSTAPVMIRQPLSHTAGNRACPRTSPGPRRKPRREHEPLREQRYSWTGAKADARPIFWRLQPACIAAPLRGSARRSASRRCAASQRRLARCATAGTNQTASAASAHRLSRRLHHLLSSIGCVQERQVRRGISHHHSKRRSQRQQRTLAMARLEPCPGLQCDSENTSQPAPRLPVRPRRAAQYCTRSRETLARQIPCGMWVVLRGVQLKANFGPFGEPLWDSSRACPYELG